MRMNGYYLKWSLTIILIVLIALAPFVTTVEETLPLVGLIVFVTISRLLLSWLFDLLPSLKMFKKEKLKKAEEYSNYGNLALLEYQEYNKLAVKLRSVIFTIALVLAFAVGFALLVDWGQIFDNIGNYFSRLYVSLLLFNKF